MIIGLVIGVIAGSLFLSWYQYTPMGYQGPGMRYQGPMGYEDGRYYPPGCCQGPISFASNGEKIYFTGINDKGERIPFTGGPQWLSMRGGSCVNCHGRDGSGGLTPMMCDEKAADIRYSALKKEMGDEEIKIAITKGVHEGKGLDWCMPRWQLTDEDLNDLIEYLKKLE